MNKKIAIDARMIEFSGIGTVIKNVLKRLPFFMPRTTFYLLGNENTFRKYSYLSRPNVIFIQCNCPIYSIKEQLELIHKIPADTDLLWIPHYNIPVFYRGKILVTVHDVFHLDMPQYIDGFLKKIYAHVMFRALARKATKVICVSEFTEKRLYEHTNISLSKVTVVYNGVDKFWQIPLKIEKRIFTKPYILCVGNVKPHKNLKTLVLAFQSIMHKIPHTLVIVGRKEGFITSDSEIVELSQKLGSRIRFTGYISDEELKNYYHFADLFIFPSLYEGFGLPPLEAMATGCNNILCSDIPVLTEIYGNYVKYFDVYNPNDLALKILNQLKVVYNVSSKDLISKLSWDETAYRYLKIINSIL
ncbi:glycosyltransferase family 4 protein [Megasphaera sp.]|uniref:glycosyltransferase family 4 protein n=1 Tax=Megasphaera sp. TaxID=2023260 RepID=UPI003520E400